MMPLSILHIDDSADDVELILFELQRSGLAVDSRRVEDEAGLRAALDERAWDVVLSDFSLPRFDTMTALTILHDHGLDIPFIVVSGFIGETTAVSLLKAGAHDFVPKAKLARLVPAIERELKEARLRQEHREAQAALVESRGQLQELSAHLQLVREEERAGIARELHDQLGQMLTALKMDVSWLRNRIQPLDPTVRDKMGAMTRLIDETVECVRRISSDLRPVMLDDLGLRPAIEWLLESLAERCDIAWELDTDRREYVLDHAHLTAAFRVVQECLTNVMRHALASEVAVQVNQDASGLHIVVRDNGVGIRPQAAGRKRYGLIGMRERVASLGGQVLISSELEGGTTIDINFPQGGAL